MPFWVAKNRQKDKDNAFARRAKRQREEPEQEPLSTPEETDLSLEAAVQQAASVLSETPVLDAAEVPEAVSATENKRGRKPSSAVAAREARVLEIVQDSGDAGVSKPDIAQAMEEKEQQVYTSLRKLAQAGKVESKYVSEVNGYRWFTL